MSLRIAMVDNLSAAAFRAIPPPHGATLLLGPPSQTLFWMANGQCDASLVPVAGLRMLEHLAEPLGAYGIACEGAVGSVLLFSRAPLREIIEKRRPVFVTPHSQTSRQLVRVLCRLSYGRDPLLSGSPAISAARLFIGDEAVDRNRGERNWPVVRDLCEWWYALTGAPFVFARWVVRRELSVDKRLQLQDWLEECTALAGTPHGVNHLATMSIREGRLEGPLIRARSYYQKIRPRLERSDLHGLNTFLHLIREEQQCARTA